MSNASTVQVSNITNRQLRSPSFGLDEAPPVPRHYHPYQNEKPKAKGTSTRLENSPKRRIPNDRNNSHDSSRINDGNYVGTTTGEQIISLFRAEPSFPGEGPWYLENENIPKKEDFDEMAMAKTLAGKDKSRTPSLQETSKNYLFQEQKPTKKGVQKRHGVTHETSGFLGKHGKDSHCDKHHCGRLIFLDGEEGEFIAPRIDDTHKYLGKLHGPGLIMIDGVEEAREEILLSDQKNTDNGTHKKNHDVPNEMNGVLKVYEDGDASRHIMMCNTEEAGEEIPTSEIRPGAVSVDGPHMSTIPRAAVVGTNTNNPITANVENIHTVPEATLVNELEGSSKTLPRKKFLFVAFALFAVGAILGWQLIPGGNPIEDGIQSPGLPTNHSMRDFLLSVSPNSEDALFDNSSAQNKALDWIVADSTNKSYPNHQIIQRWVLATLFYSTSGENWTEPIGWLSDDHECNWTTSKATCDDTKNITVLYLTDNNLFGSIPLELGLLSDSLSYIDFRKNTMGRTLPTEIGSLTNLTFLSLSENDLQGQIPSEIGLLTNLVHLDLSQNHLSGTIPSTLGESQSLLQLLLFDNDLIGPVPDTVCRLREKALIEFVADCDELYCPQSTCCTSCF